MRAGDPPPLRGPLLVVANHPGAYDALALFAATGRDDLRVVASDRPFLRAMPALARHLILVPESPSSRSIARARGLREAGRCLAEGGALLHFGAGRIEPDPAFHAGPDAERLGPWQAGTGRLVRATSGAGGAVVAALVSGVHSRRAKELHVIRWAESRGVTTLAPLLQVAVPRYREVEPVVRFSHALRARELADKDAGRVTAVLRARALDLWPAASGAEERGTEGAHGVRPAR
jgi:hypothetical protein